MRLFGTFWNAVFITCLLQLTTGHGWPKTNSATISGRVVDKHEQIPLNHVQVFIETIQRGDVTDDQGRFEIVKVPPGSYDLVFRIQGYKTALQRGIEVKPNSTAEINVALESTVIEFDELLVTANRRANMEQDVSQQVSVVSAREIQERNVHQSSEIFREEAGIVVQKTNQGGGSPIIRGLNANKLLLMVDGVRMNNATYRGGNLQYLNTVDSGSLQQLEVVHGPNSVLYGSDALGGVINIITKKPNLSDGRDYRFSGNGSVIVSSADETQTLNVGLGAANSNWGAHVDFSYKSFGDIRRGDSGGETLMRRLREDSRADRILNETQSPNSYETFDLNSGLLLKLSEFQELTATWQANRQDAVPRYDVFEARTDSVFLFDPQERDLVYVRYRNTHGNRFFNSGTMTISVQRQFERRLRQRFGSSIETSDEFGTITTGAQLQFNKVVKTRHHFVYGAELYYDQVDTKSFAKELSTGEVAATDPLFPDGSTFLNFGLFAQDDFAVTKRWQIGLGARLSAFRLRAPFAEGTTGGQFGTVVQSPTSLTGSFGSLLHLSDEIGFVTNVAQGFRTPNLDDVSKLGAGQGGTVFDVPNPDVGPERTLSVDAGFKVSSGRVRANFIGYYNHITDLLLRRPAEFNGSPFFVEQGDTMAVFRKENAGRAYTSGFDLSADFLLTSKIVGFCKLSFTRGQNLSDDEPLGAIPPFNGMVGVRWSAGSHQMEFHTRFAAQQDRLSLEDMEDLRIPEGGTPGWYVLDIRWRSELTGDLSVSFGVRNLLDRNYREHLSGFNAPGRNFVFGIRGSF